LELNQASEISDDALVKAVVDGDGRALEFIYTRYQELLRTIILSVNHDEAEVDDVLHDVMLQIWEQARRYKPNENGLRGLLVTLARRRSLDRLRRNLAYRRATEGLKRDFENPLLLTDKAAAVDLLDLSNVLYQVIRGLPKAQQEVVELTFFQGMTQREIAAKRHISLGTVKTRLQLAQRKLHKSLLPLQDKI